MPIHLPAEEIPPVIENDVEHFLQAGIAGYFFWILKKNAGHLTRMLLLVFIYDLQYINASSCLFFTIIFSFWRTSLATWVSQISPGL